MKKLLLLLGAAVVCLVSPACDMHPADTLSPGHGNDHDALAHDADH